MKTIPKKLAAMKGPQADEGGEKRNREKNRQRKTKEKREEGE